METCESEAGLSERVTVELIELLDRDYQEVSNNETDKNSIEDKDSVEHTSLMVNDKSKYITFIKSY